MQQQILDFNRLYCQLHPYQIVTNYCNDQKCLVGLCATCICTHTQMHGQIGTIPQYQNIRDTFSCLYDQARSQITHLQEDNNRLGSLRQSVDVKKISIKKRIRELKQETICKIKEQFEMVQRKILNDISAQEKKQGYHSHIRFQSLSKSLSRQTQTLLRYIEGLNSPSFLQWTRKLKRQGLDSTINTRLQMQRQISENETYTANLKWSHNLMEQVANAIKKNFTLQFVIPNKQNGQARNCIPLFHTNNTNILTRSSSQPKVLSRNNSTLTLNRFTDSTSYSSFFDQNSAYLSRTMQKQSFLMKNKPLSSGKSDSDILASKQNNLTKSSFYSDLVTPQMLNKSILGNNSSYIKPTYQNQRLSSLIQMKRNQQFDSTITSELSNTQSNKFPGDSRARLTY